MKKIIGIVFIVLLGILTLGSCKKEYTCECISLVTYQEYASSTASRTIKYGTKRDVKKSCEKGSQTGEGYETKCNIK